MTKAKISPEVRTRREMTPIDSSSIPLVKVHIRSVNGQDALFTDDGRMIAGQSSNNHSVYLTDPDTGETVKSFRASLIIDNCDVSYRGPWEC